MNNLVEAEIWLREAFAQLENIKETYIIGSVLSKVFSDINDVDVVQLIDFAQSCCMKTHAHKIHCIESLFFTKFSKKLHVTTFTLKEFNDFEVFMSLNFNLKIV